MNDTLKGKWALILGASSGFGMAAARELAAAGVNIAGVHLDRKGTLPNVEKLVADLRGQGAETAFFNVNAADDGKRAEVIAASISDRSCWTSCRAASGAPNCLRSLTCASAIS